MQAWHGPYTKQLKHGIEGQWRTHVFAADLGEVRAIEKAEYLTNENIHKTTKLKRQAIASDEN